MNNMKIAQSLAIKRVGGGRLLLFSVVLLSLFGCGQQEVEMSIVSFNVRYNSWYDIDGDNRWANRREAVVRMINEESPVAIGLQEALIDQLVYLDSCLPGYCRVGVGRDDGIEEGEFMAVYYDTARLQLLSAATRWLSDTTDRPAKGWDAACYRTVTVTRFAEKRSGKQFVYLNTHLDHVGKVARAESTKLLARIVRDECGELPVILGGDMNSTIDDTIFNSLYAAGLQAARDIADSTSNDITYNAFGNEQGSVIDHFFVRDARVRRFRTLDGDYGVPYISDHYPIEIKINLNQ